MRRLAWVLLLVLSISAQARAGDLSPSAGPDDAGSAMFSGRDLLNRLETGTNAPLRTGAFTEPAEGPTTGTMPTLNEIMAAAPATNAAAATPNQVLADHVYWGLMESDWGLRTGTMAARSLSASNVTVAAGYYAATTLTAVDADLATANIRAGVNVFGVTGTPAVVNTASGTAEAGDLLAGKMAYARGAAITGTMASQSLSPFTVEMAAGYYDAVALTIVERDLASSNILSGISIFGVTGTPAVVNTASGTAAAGDMLTGKIAFVNGAAIAGTMASQTLSAAHATVGAGYYAATTLPAVDADLTATNIKAGVTIFGVTGTVYAAAVPKTWQTTTFQTGDDGNLQKGVAWPNPRFTIGTGVDGTNCVTDNLTGLIWARDANLGDAMHWYDALVYCEALDYGGQTDWRLPNRRELLSLVDDGRCEWALCNTAGTGPWTEGDPFTGVQGGYYWSGTTFASGTLRAWLVNFEFGIVFYDGMKTESFHVWPVRGGP